MERQYRAAVKKFGPMFSNVSRAIKDPLHRTMIHNIAAIFFDAGFRAGMRHQREKGDVRVKLTPWKGNGRNVDASGK